MSTGTNLRVLIADDHAGFRRGMCTLLSSLPGVEVIGEAASGDEAVSAANARLPDVVLMDLDMPGGGLAATRRLAEEAPHVAVLVLTMSTEEQAVLAALQAGARGYLVKGAARTEVERALRMVADGGVVIGSALAQRLSAILSSSGPGAAPDADLAQLTTREREVLELMSAGLNNVEIARRLQLSAKTIRNLVSSIFGKLRSSNRVQVVMRAREAGLGGNPPAP
ncbi:DNA-binding response regulator, NarL/FixJ family, contains REC and HTH domains [Micromonospora viridifaciens]|uniref:DNA-binding response regulator, NarL/FixJ family, contains REC and HTH domains n=1 Tax=Micromonospora viridifaciens TaxID=1881 RepID=A0A1C4YG13_MICVI|nr:response regulator transcription factor [Micromonospora viridifaciens]SCF19665.1 DNA-binding response regulator, NarL/FixJ family, contains REC and HTH domains [Micromonospora viridifaciens]